MRIMRRKKLIDLTKKERQKLFIEFARSIKEDKRMSIPDDVNVEEITNFLEKIYQTKFGSKE